MYSHNFFLISPCHCQPPPFKSLVLRQNYANVIFFEYICSYTIRANKPSYPSLHTLLSCGLLLPIIIELVHWVPRQVNASKTLLWFSYNNMFPLTTKTASWQQHQMWGLLDFECPHVPRLNLLKGIDWRNSLKPLKWFILIIRPKHWWSLSICLSVRS